MPPVEESQGWWLLDRAEGAVVGPPSATEVGLVCRHCVRVWDRAGSRAGTPLVVAWRVVEVDSAIPTTTADSPEW